MIRLNNSVGKILLIFLLVMPFAVTAKEMFTVIAGDNYPYAYKENGELKGVMIDLFNEKIRDLVGYTRRIQLKSFARVYQELNTDNRNVIALATAFFPEREREFKWIFHTNDDAMLFVSKKGMKVPKALLKLQFNRVFDIAIGVIPNTLMEDVLSKNSICKRKLIYAKSPRHNLKMLFSGQTQVMFTSEAMVKSTLKDKEFYLNKDDIEFHYPAYIKFPVYVVGNLHLATEVYALWLQAMETAYRDGTMAKIFHRYGIELPITLHHEKFY